MSPPTEPLSARWLRRLARGVCRYPRVFVYAQAVLFVACVFITVRYLQFSTQRSDLVGADKEYHRNYLEYKQNFNAEDEMVAVAESEDSEKNRQFVERLGARLLAETNLFSDVLFNNDIKTLGNKALLFVPEEDLESMAEKLHELQPFLVKFTQATNLESLFRRINQQFRAAQRLPETTQEILVGSLPALQRILDQAVAALQRPGTPPSPGMTALFNAGERAQEQVYITFNHGHLYLVASRPRSPEVKPEAVRRLRQLVEITRNEIPGVNAAATGEPVLEYDEMRQSQRDTTVASIVALILVALVFILGYRESGRPLKATACLVVGLAYTLAYATLTVGHLNILTITFVPMLVGLAIDFGIHLVTRYEEELRLGRAEDEAIEVAMVNTGQGIFTGCFTTAVAFFAMGITDFKGIREMGIICGGGLLICLVPMMTLLPVLIRRGRQNVLDHHHPAGKDHRARIERLWLDHPGTVVAIALVLTGLAWQSGLKVRFDYNLLNLQSRGLPAVEFEKKLIGSAERSVLYCVVLTDSLDEAVQIQRRLEDAKLNTVSQIDSMAQFLTQDADRKLALIGQVKAELASLNLPQTDAPPMDAEQMKELGQTLYSFEGYLSAAAETAAARGAAPNLVEELRQLRVSSAMLRKEMNTEPRALKARKLDSYQQAFFNDIRSTFEALLTQDNREGMRVEDLPPTLRHRFVSHDGTRHVVQVYPRDNVWEREGQEAFVGDLRRTLDPERTGRPIITGPPVQLYEYTRLLKDSYEEAAGYATIAIAFMVLIQFRSFVGVALALLPVGVGILWMRGFMGWHGIPFNPANIITLPLVVGIGVTNGIHILTRYHEDRSPSLLAKSTGKAVLVSGFTTIAGFGSLMLGKHQGIASLGYVMAVGTATCMIAALTLLPALLTFLGRLGWNPKGKTQWRKRELVTGLGGTEVKTSIARES